MGFAPDQVMRMSVWEFAAVCDAHAARGGKARPMSARAEADVVAALDAAPETLAE